MVATPRIHAGSFHVSSEDVQRKDTLKDQTDLVTPATAPTTPARSKPRASLFRLAAAWFNFYRQLFVACLLANLVIITLAVTDAWPTAARYKGQFALGNVALAVLIRNEVFLRVVYWALVTCFRLWTPLCVRLGITKLLVHLGGVHSGCATSSLAWVAYIIHDLAVHPEYTTTLITSLAAALLLLLIVSCVGALPCVRYYHHNTFEYIHRFAGWSSLAVLWVFVLAVDSYDPYTQRSEWGRHHLLVIWQFWCAVLTTTCIVLPWLFVRKVKVDYVIPAARSIIIIHFPHGVKAGILGRISRRPLFEWHAFGIISTNRGRNDTHAMLIVGLGDFTRGLISDPPEHLYVRGFRFAGLPYLVPMYDVGVAIATGSGIGVVLSCVIQKKTNWHLIWVARDFEKVYGSWVLQLLRENFPADQLTLWDSGVYGRPNTVELVEEVYKKAKAEVVFVTSNPSGTTAIVNGCRRKGMPAFGPIWDS